MAQYNGRQDFKPNSESEAAIRLQQYDASQVAALLEMQDADGTIRALIGPNGVFNDREALRLASRGLKGETTPLGVTSTQAILNAQRRVALIGAKKGESIANIFVGLTVIAGGTLPAGLYFQIWKDDGTLVFTSADYHADAQWSTAIGWTKFAMGFNFPADGGYYLGLTEDGHFGTTDFQMLAGSISNGAFSAAMPGGGKAYSGVQATASHADALVIAASTLVPYFAWN